ncbi:MAG: hypothetical protein ACI4O5_08275 [Oscillospiraceae bacterium]
MYDYLRYKERLEKALEQIRAHYLGQDRPLTELIPAGANLPPEQLAEQIADVLTFHLPRARAWTDAELRESWRWLRAAALFLWNCPPEDRTPYGLLKLANLDREMREELDLSAFPTHYAAEFAEVPTGLKMTLEAAIWMLTEPSLKTLETLEELLK